MLTDIGPEKESNESQWNSSISILHETVENATRDLSGEKENGTKPGVLDVEALSADGLQKILSRSLSRASCTDDPGPPPDGGLHAWTQVFATHLVIFLTWGYINSFGVFQNYYVTALNRPPSDVSWVGSVQVFFLFFVGTFSGRALDAGWFRTTFVAGAVLQLVGTFMTSLSTSYWQLFLAQGVCTGIGNGLQFCPSVSLVSTYFSKKRALALSIVASGTSTGGLVFPAIVESLLPKIGFQWTIRVLGFLMLGIQLLAFSLIRTRIPPRTTGPLVEWSAFKSPPYALFSIAMFFEFMGLYFGFYYVSSFSTDILHASYTDSIHYLLMINGIGIAGRLIPAYLADRYFGPTNCVIPVALGAGILVYCWAFVDSQAGLTAFALIYGFFAAGVQGLFPSTLASLTVDLRKAGVRMGMVLSIVAVPSLAGAPIAGALIERRGGSYLFAQMFAASILICGVLTLVATRISRTGLRLLVKV